jgi:phenylpropionate dioxygenase-like ring-hydroxylating dioxygenase large terminal subunit
MFIRNAWYVGAWDHEVGRDMLRRILLDEPVVFFRREDGTPVALEDRCCHRQAPLSMGKLRGDIVECPYHGLQFNETGACVRIPSQDRIPAAARVTAYPVVERNHWIWIWMGDPALANPDLIEDFHWIGDPEWGYGGDRFHLEGNYLLLVDNLLDTTHLAFVHPTTLGTDDFASSEVETKRDERRVRVDRWLMDRLPAPFHKRMGGFPDGAHVDRWQLTTFAPPCFVRLDVGSALAGTGARQGDRSQGVNMMSLNALTPETEGTTHYFWAQVYNFKVDQRWMADLVRSQVTKAFREDLAIVREQQRNIDLGPHPTIDLQQDAGGIAARRIVERLIAEEQPGAGKAAAE